MLNIRGGVSFRSHLPRHFMKGPLLLRTFPPRRRPSPHFFAMSTPRALPNLTGCVVARGTLHLDKMIGSGTYGRLYRASDVEASKASSSCRSSWSFYSSSTAESSPSSSSFITSSSASSGVYAVKCLHKPDRYFDDAFHDRERALQTLVSSHPNIVTLQRQFTDARYKFLVMDYHPGGDMFHAIIDGVYHNNAALIKCTFAGVVEGVRFCHSKGVFHRDIKPDNILVDIDGGNPCITDFGFATSAVVSDEPNCGTMAYMPPQVFKSRSTVTRYRPALSDAWALAITLVNLVTVLNPWYGARNIRDERYTQFQRCECRSHSESFLCSILPISRSLAALLVRALVYEPAARVPLEEFAKEVQEMENLFMSEEDLMRANPALSRQWASMGVESDSVRPRGRGPYPVYFPLLYFPPSPAKQEEAGPADLTKESASPGFQTATDHGRYYLNFRQIVRRPRGGIRWMRFVRRLRFGRQ
ncbi:kinase-like domain-containing protein [Roridomyces roridus]|uniref:non-specific serine/threonine protein kinase n=1 Tax=Roridomyces roridus TaxID=1738132 RepID=A0AAD7BFB2_9AGAR|nr:kinase-like domain-containing protein [Roridomyces roridus]